MANKRSSYSPTSYFFNPHKWLTVLSNTEKQDKDFIKAGFVIGKVLFDIDTKFQKYLKSFGALSELELIYFQQHETFRYFRALSRGESSEHYEIVLEAITDGVRLLMGQARATKTKQKSVAQYQTLLQLACQRIYLTEQWQRVSSSRSTIKVIDSEIRFVSLSKSLDFGEKMAVYRFQDHHLQVRHEMLQEPVGKFHHLLKMPSSIIAHSNGIEIQFQYLDEADSLHASTLTAQVPFFYSELMQVKLRDYQAIAGIDLLLFWIVFSKLASIFVNEQILTSDALYQSFSEQQLAELMATCANMPMAKAIQLIHAFTNEFEELHDFYIKPLYKIDQEYFLCIPVLASGQFTRVIDHFVNSQMLADSGTIKSLNKGKYFEKEFANTLKEQIDHNELLEDGFCKVLCVGFKQKRGKENEEIDLVLRIGETYLLVEEKSFSYRVGNRGFHNNLETILDSNIQQKKQFFLDDYQYFREHYDKTANFDLEPENVLCCYLSSVPHCVGIQINETKVLDPSILERYFGAGHFLLVNTDGTKDLFRFYRNSRQAEENLRRYLSELPQLSKYYQHFGYQDSNFEGVFENQKVVFEEPYFDLSEENEQSTYNYLSSISNGWSDL